MPYWDTRVRALRISGQADSTVSNLGTTNTEFKTTASTNWTEGTVPGEIMVNADSSIDKEKQDELNYLVISAHLIVAKT